jgi:hypothetical protein
LLLKSSGLLVRVPHRPDHRTAENTRNQIYRENDDYGDL